MHSLTFSVLCLFLYLLFRVDYSIASYEYFMLTEEWPSTYCQIQKQTTKPCIRQPPSTFKIHGLWPQNHTDPQPMFCDKTQLDKNNIPLPLQAKLMTDWPNLTGFDHYEFWKLEWNKHGTCSINKFSPNSYLNLALQIKSKNDLVAILVRAHIVPHPTTTYDKNLIFQAIKGSVGRSPQISCFEYKGPGQTYFNLSEIRLCLNDIGTTFEDCPTNFIKCKAKMIYWPI